MSGNACLAQVDQGSKPVNCAPSRASVCGMRQVEGVEPLGGPHDRVGENKGNK